jgi:hypothetical protein
VLVHGGREILAAPSPLRPVHRALDTDRGEARPHCAVESEEAADIEVTFGPNGERVEGVAELLGPEPVGDGLAGSERRQRVLHRVRSHVGTAERGRLVHLEAVCPGPDVHLGDAGQRSIRAEDRLRVTSVAGDALPVSAISVVSDTPDLRIRGTGRSGYFL